MATPGREVLSEHFQTKVGDRRVRAGVFLTYQFEPDFFEQQILPVFFNTSRSLEPKLALVDLQEALSGEDAALAVYYDQRALEPGPMSPKLDVRRIPIAWSKGYCFHPKIVLLLVERRKADDDGKPEQSLLVAALSANLTENGWWHNVEACHVEELPFGAKTKLRGDLLELIRRVKQAAPPGEDHSALEAIRRFVLRLRPRAGRTEDGRLCTRLYGSSGWLGVAEFLRQQKLPRRLNLEVISPFLDQDDCRPLRELVDALDPREVRVYLPIGEDGVAAVSRKVFEAVPAVANKVSWGKLPTELLRAGRPKGAAERRVHAKVYRLFGEKPRYEAVLVGSVNLTTAAHRKGKNFETAFLVQTRLERGDAPGWWLSAERARPARFEAQGEADAEEQGPGVALRVRYSWASGRADVLWQGTERSPRLALRSDVPLFEIDPLTPGKRRQLSEAEAARLADVLRVTSFLTVSTNGHGDARILVEEEGMARKPSLDLGLGVADIMHCWSAASPDQKQALIEQRFREREASDPKRAVHPSAPSPQGRSVFDTFAGYFHAFGCRERGLEEALEEGRVREAEERLFGRRYDSLPTLLDRLDDPEQRLEAVDRYVIVLCAQQLVSEIRKAAPDFVASHRGDFDDLRRRLEMAEEVCQEFTFGTPRERSRFLGWFRKWFVKRARRVAGARA